MKYTESDLEDWVCENIDRVIDGKGEIRVVDRQIELAGGRLDVLAARYVSEGDLNWVCYTVIELKRERIDEAAVAQCLRYYGSFASAWEQQDASAEHRHVHVSAMVAAPELSRNAGLIVDALPNLRFVKLEPEMSVSVEHWDDLIIPGRREESEVALQLAKDAADVHYAAMGSLRVADTPLITDGAGAE